MKKTVLFYSLAFAGCFGLLKVLENHFLISDLKLDMYFGLLATLFIGLGIWVGMQVVRDQKLKNLNKSERNVIDEEVIKKLQISHREKEVLDLIAIGLSNKEIADQLFVSENTIKTHSSNLFSKLDVKRRTQAVQRAKELNII